MKRVMITLSDDDYKFIQKYKEVVKKCTGLRDISDSSAVLGLLYFGMEHAEKTYQDELRNARA